MAGINYRLPDVGSKSLKHNHWTPQSHGRINIAGIDSHPLGKSGVCPLKIDRGMAGITYVGHILKNPRGIVSK